jgi:hypothetical protein
MISAEIFFSSIAEYKYSILVVFVHIRSSHQLNLRNSIVQITDENCSPGQEKTKILLHRFRCAKRGRQSPKVYELLINCQVDR